MSIALRVSVALACASCGGGKQETPPPVLSSTKPVETAPPDAAPPPPDAPMFAGMTITAAAQARLAKMGPDVPFNCRRYVVATEGLELCSKLPPESLAAMRQGLDAIEQSWAGELTPEVVAALDEGCGQAVEAIAQASVALGCAEPEQPAPP